MKKKYLFYVFYWRDRVDICYWQYKRLCLDYFWFLIGMRIGKYIVFSGGQRLFRMGCLIIFQLRILIDQFKEIQNVQCGRLEELEGNREISQFVFFVVKKNIIEDIVYLVEQLVDMWEILGLNKREWSSVFGFLVFGRCSQ